LAIGDILNQAPPQGIARLQLAAPKSALGAEPATTAPGGQWSSAFTQRMLFALPVWGQYQLGQQWEVVRSDCLSASVAFDADGGRLAIGRQSWASATQG